MVLVISDAKQPGNHPKRRFMKKRGIFRFPVKRQSTVEAAARPVVALAFLPASWGGCGVAARVGRFRRAPSLRQDWQSYNRTAYRPNSSAGDDSSAFHLRIELDLRRREVDVSHELAGLFGTMFAVHPGVFPFDGEWAIVPNAIQGADDFLEINAAMAETTEVPAAPGLAEIKMR